MSEPIKYMGIARKATNFLPKALNIKPIYNCHHNVDVVELTSSLFLETSLLSAKCHNITQYMRTE